MATSPTTVQTLLESLDAIGQDPKAASARDAIRLLTDDIHKALAKRGGATIKAAQGEADEHARLMQDAVGKGDYALALAHANAAITVLTGMPATDASKGPKYVNVLSGVPVSGMRPPWET